MTAEQALNQHLEMADQHEKELAEKEERELYGMTVAELETRKPESQPDSAEAASYLHDAQAYLRWPFATDLPKYRIDNARTYINRAQYFLDKITREYRRKEQAKNETF